MDNDIVRHDTSCRLCGSRDIAEVLTLKDTPMEDQFLPAAKGPVEQPAYPLVLALCKGCGYVFLPYVVSPRVSYSDYVYVSATTVGLRNHYDQYAQEIAEQFRIPSGSLVVDLGSNDGSMLASFKKVGMKVVGVEPAGAIARAATDNGIPTIHAFFTSEVRQRITEESGRASVVTANYMYANVDDVLDFTKNVAELLAPDGVFVVQTGYHPEQFKIKMFDYIYHEHFSYFTVDVLNSIFKTAGLEAIHVVKTKPKGGSIRIVAQRKGGQRPVTDAIGALLEEERVARVRDEEPYRELSKELDSLKEQLHKQLDELKKRGKRIVALGASHSTTTLLYHFELASYIDYIVDDNVLKHNTWSPGAHIPVYPTDRLYQDKPDAALVLAWQHQDTILERHKRYVEQGGRFIVPLPFIRSVG
ncbi:MAG: class I SAM-dependent methyltransferase [Spirochaetia bacterium]|nr:class I SAM-dependent methyltransferase [Spirochaetia bacterium]